MAQREFVDDNGRVWTVWEVHPERRDRRQGQERRRQPRSAPDRRREQLLTAVVGRDLAKGWLAFESQGGAERRRYAPIPEGWALKPDDELRALWSAATAVTAKRRFAD